jgi:hypothetical protein
MEHWQGTHTKTWPPHLRKPVRFGSAEASMSIEVQPNEQEREFLKAAGISERVGKAAFTIEHGRYIRRSEVNNTIRKLFEFHLPSVGVGLLDYIAPTRFYPNQGVGDINAAGSDAQLRSIVSSFHRGWSDTSKFHTLKTFIVASIVNDATEFRETGVQVDSLRILRETFDHFFSPKRFIGPKKNPATGQFEVLVETPFGLHDIDFLSDGEKEVLNVMGYMFQFRDLENIFLWDTPESHLNAALETRLYEALRKVALAFHSWVGADRVIASGGSVRTAGDQRRSHDRATERCEQTSPPRDLPRPRCISGASTRLIACHLCRGQRGRLGQADSRPIGW